MQLPMMNRGGDESKLSQTRYWISMGGYGISPDMLELTGFWSESVIKKFQTSGIDTSQAVEQIFGGVLRFKPLPGKRFQERLSAIINTLNMILQVKRQVNDVLNHIRNSLKAEMHSNDMDFLPEDLPEDIKALLKRERKYVVASDPNIAGQILQIIPLLEGLQRWIGYYPSIYGEANTLFHMMVLETVNLSMTNLSEKNYPQPQYVELEAVADQVANTILEG